MSLWINILVLLPICIALSIDHKEMAKTFGENTTARQILFCMYATLLTMSAWLLYSSDKKMVLTVLLFQICYKILSVLFIKNRRTPVLWFNLAIAIFHSATVVTYFS